MVKRTIYVLTDDIDGGRANETVAFGLDGTQYTIDLSTVNSARMREALAPFVAAGKRAPKTLGSNAPVRPTPPLSLSLADQAAEHRRIREWAQQQGLRISPRGRIAQSIVDAYHESVA